MIVALGGARVVQLSSRKVNVLSRAGLSIVARFAKEEQVASTVFNILIF